MNATENHATKNARGHMESITELVRAKNEARDADKFGFYEGAEVTMDDMVQRIQEYPLSVEVRTDWHLPGETLRLPPSEYRILLTTGGPALRIIGELTQYLEPETARMEWQDWGTPWTEYALDDDQTKALVDFAQQFYYGES